MKANSLLLLLSGGLICASVSRSEDPIRAEAATETASRRHINAAWYNVPVQSLARRRAEENELTAAHNRLPLGTLVRVTNTHNGKTVVVRITDRGITDRLVKIDLCREAAEQLGILRQGIARVRIEIVKGVQPISAGKMDGAAAQ